MLGLQQKVESIFSLDSINAKALESGFQQRKSKLSPHLFLESLLMDNVNQEKISLEQHCYLFNKHHKKRITKQGFAQKFNTSTVEFMKLLLEEAMQSQLSLSNLKSTYHKHFTSIRIMDSTEFKLPDKFKEVFSGYSSDASSCAQIQFEYDLFSEQIKNLSLNGALKSDRTVAHEIMSGMRKGELIIRDLGYYNFSLYEKLHFQGIYFISRLHPQVNIYIKRADMFEQLTHRKIETMLKKRGVQYLDIPVFIGKEALIPVRLTANLLSSKDAKQRLNRYKKRGQKINKEKQIVSNLNLFITNVEEDKISSDEIYRLYKIRWQIELIFKTWKSILNIDKIAKVSAERLICYLLSKLLWILMCWDVYRINNVSFWEDKNKVISIYKFYNYMKVEVENLREAFFRKAGDIGLWLKENYQQLIQYTVKENKKGRIPIEKLMGLI